MRGTFTMIKKITATALLSLSVWVLAEFTAAYIKRDDICKHPLNMNVILPTSELVCQIKN